VILKLHLLDAGQRATLADRDQEHDVITVHASRCRKVPVAATGAGSTLAITNSEFRVARVRRLARSRSNRAVNEHPGPDLPWQRLFAMSTAVGYANTGERPARSRDDARALCTVSAAVQTPG
jgi:hypothetical protein